MLIIELAAHFFKLSFETVLRTSVTERTSCMRVGGKPVGDIVTVAPAVWRGCHLFAPGNDLGIHIITYTVFAAEERRQSARYSVKVGIKLFGNFKRFISAVAI